MQQAATAERRNNLAPIPFEADAPHLGIVGELPRELNGTMYRNGPNPQFSSPGAHWFVGDGMLHALHLKDGRASYRNRWVRTPKWLAEHDAGRALFGGFGAAAAAGALAARCCFCSRLAATRSNLRLTWARPARRAKLVFEGNVDLRWRCPNGHKRQPGSLHRIRTQLFFRVRDHSGRRGAVGAKKCGNRTIASEPAALVRADRPKWVRLDGGHPGKDPYPFFGSRT